MNKDIYNRTEITITEFDAEDTITTSGNDPSRIVYKLEEYEHIMSSWW